ncbi:hypothetical protein ASA1KI_02230 [Opitutales bacterium ASA1]|nr:hypothetical protein ASA1KI_02230 [Opitutales bacterium ASA1]
MTRMGTDPEFSVRISVASLLAQREVQVFRQKPCMWRWTRSSLIASNDVRKRRALREAGRRRASARVFRRAEGPARPPESLAFGGTIVGISRAAAAEGEPGDRGEGENCAGEDG